MDVEEVKAVQIEGVHNFDALIIGAGASGLMCALTAARRGKKVLILEMNQGPGKKILISGGGRCNFTNLNSSHQYFHGENSKFAISALKKFSPQDIINFMEKNNIAFFEKKKGELFCKGPARLFLSALLKKCSEFGVEIIRGVSVLDVKKEGQYLIEGRGKTFRADSLVIATGGVSFPKIGVSDLGYRLAKKFGHSVVKIRPALVPFKVKGMASMSGLSLPVDLLLKKYKKLISDDLLFTHKGLSGPSVLSASLYLEKGESFLINFLPGLNVEKFLLEAKEGESKKNIYHLLADYLPSKFLKLWIERHLGEDRKIAELSKPKIRGLSQGLNAFELTPEGDLGYDKAEVTKGGVATKDLSSKTMESRIVPGLYFVGEVVDITGELGGFNFCWAWASGFVAGSSI